MPIIQQLVDRRISLRNDPAFVLAIIYTVGFYAFVQSLFIYTVGPVNEKLIGQMLPVLSMIQGGIVQYFYTKQQQVARDKQDEVIKKLADTANTAATTAAVQSGVPMDKLPNPETIVKPPAPGNLTTNNVDITANTANVTEKK